MAFLDLALIFITALGFSVVAVPFLLYFAHSKEIYDQPDHTKCNSRRVHVKPIPRLGGIAIVGGFFFTLLIWQVPLYSNTIYGCSLILFLLGLVDDLKNLSAKFRLSIQFYTATFTVFFADLSLKWIAITPNFILPIPHVLGFFLAIFIIIGAINAMNMIDGLDGLASGVGLIGISILSYFLFLHARKHDLLLLFTVPMLGSIIGFLKYNTHPSIIFMGDCGSNWLGFMVGAFILTIANSNPIVPLISILLAFSIPIFDTAHVIILRLMNGKNPMMADNRHFHHSLIKLGFSHSQSVGIIYFLMFFFGVLGMIPVAFKPYGLWWIPWIGAVLLICLLIFSIQLKQDVISKKIIAKFDFYQTQSLKKPFYQFVFFIESLQRYTIYIFLLTTSLIIILKPTILGLILAISCLGIGTNLFIKKSCSFLSACLLVLITTILFLMGNADSIIVELFSFKFHLRIVYNFIFLWLFLSTLFFCAIELKRKYFIITPTDILLILVPLLILMMPDTWEHQFGLRLLTVRGLVLFAALRMFSKNANKKNFHAKFKNASHNFPGSIPSPNLNPNP